MRAGTLSTLLTPVSQHQTQCLTQTRCLIFFLMKWFCFLNFWHNFCSLPCNITSCLLWFFWGFFWPHGSACGIWVPWPEIKPAPPALEARSRNHWTTREVHVFCFYLTISCAPQLHPKLHPDSHPLSAFPMPGCTVINTNCSKIFFTFKIFIIFTIIINFLNIFIGV